VIDTAALKETAPSLLDLANPLTTLKKVASSGGGEYSGPCPFCAGTDRFSVQPNEQRWLCRHCTDGKWADVIKFVELRDGIGFVDACKVLFGNDVQIAIPPEEYERLQHEREQIQQAEIEREQIQQETKRDNLNETRAWEPYYQLLQSHPEGRLLWNERGLSDEWIDYYKLGYCPEREFYSPGKFTTPTLTIPTWHAEKCVALQHRLLMDDPPGGKYRPQISGLGKPLFHADVFTKGIIGDVLILEGEIKTMVVFAAIWKDQPLEGHPLYPVEIVGLAGKGFKREWIPEFENAKRIWIALDPDAIDSAFKIAKLLGPDRTTIVDLPEKIDDLFLIDAIDKDLLWQLMEHGRKVNGRS